MVSRQMVQLAAATLAFCAFSGAGLAGQPDVARPSAAKPETPLGVVELFTSQGCSSCPPADELFADFVARKDIVALAYHVDYWDYLGWKDTLSSKKNTERQYAYMRAFGTRSVYTPQAVINGRTHVNGASRSAVADTLAHMDKSAQGMRVPIKVTQEGDGVVIEAGDAGIDPATPVDAHVVVVYFDPPQTISIGKGENSGRRETYWNAVSDIQTAGMWHGKAQRYELPMSEISKRGGCAVLLQAMGKDGLPGPILGAAMIRNP
ncbi:MAG: thioredoxin family protein [Mesorhizobium sp.]